MKIVDRKTFLQLPANTVFSKYTPCAFDDLMIKGETCGNDFFVQQIADSIECDSSEEFTDILDAAKQTGASVEMDFDSEGRDGMFDEDQLFAVWERGDVEKLIGRLQETLK